MTGHAWRTIEYVPYYEPPDGPMITYEWHEPATIWQRIRGQQGTTRQSETPAIASGVRQVCDACPTPHVRIVEAREEYE